MREYIVFFSFWDAHTHIKTFVILDDVSFEKTEYAKQAVKVNENLGLRDEDVAKAIEILNVSQNIFRNIISSLVLIL